MASGVIKEAFKQLGRSVGTQKGEQSIDGSRHKAETLMTSAAVASQLFRTKSEALALELLGQVSQGRLHRGLYLRRHYDGSPIYVKYGDLQGSLEEHSRHYMPYKHEDRYGVQHVRWKLVDKEEAKQNMVHSRHGGVVEAFAQHACLFTATVNNDGFTGAPNWLTYRERSQPMLQTPKLLTRGTASAAFKALNQGNVWSLNRMKELAAHTDCVIVDDTSDGAGSMKRLKFAGGDYLKYVPNFFI